MKGRLEAPVMGNAVFLLEPGTYEMTISPENIQNLWDPIALEKLAAGEGQSL